MLRLLMIFLFFAYGCCEIHCRAKVMAKSTRRPKLPTTSTTATTTLETIIQSLEIPELGIDLSNELKKLSQSINETECFDKLEEKVCFRISFRIIFLISTKIPIFHIMFRLL
jgi:hypothetical protein